MKLHRKMRIRLLPICAKAKDVLEGSGIEDLSGIEKMTVQQLYKLGLRNVALADVAVVVDRLREQKRLTKYFGAAFYGWKP